MNLSLISSIFESDSVCIFQRSLVAKVQRRQLPDVGMLFFNLTVRREHLVSDSLNEVIGLVCLIVQGQCIIRIISSLSLCPFVYPFIFSSIYIFVIHSQQVWHMYFLECSCCNISKNLITSMAWYVIWDWTASSEWYSHSHHAPL